MSTSLLNCEIALSKALGDYWSSTTTGAGSSTTLVDSALMAKANDWVSEEAYAFLIEEPVGAAAIYDERKATSLDNSNGTLTTLAFGAAPGTGIDYEIHRLFSPSDKKIALIEAAKLAYPHLFKDIWDESLVCGNWIKDGSFERWTDENTLTDWTVTTCTVTQISTAGYVKHGTYSCKIDTAAGTVSISISNFSDLQFLRGKNVTLTIQAHCDTADCLRISIDDGATQTYSSYHAGDSAWTEDNPRNDDMYVTQYIEPNATEVTLTIHHEVATGISHVDDARAISGSRSLIYIGHLGLAQNKPHQVQIEPSYYSQQEPWITVRGCKVNSDGYLYIPTDYPSDRRLRIRGIGYLDFLSSGSVSTSWVATIEVDDPQLKILVAEAAIYLYTQMSLPNYETGVRKDYQEAVAYWTQKSLEYHDKYGMDSPPVTINYGVR